MKKVLTMLLILCLGLCACGTNTGASPAEIVEEITLPTIPQISEPSLSVPEPQSGEEANEEVTEEVTEAIDPIGETYPWETEFNEEGYTVIEVEMADTDERIVGKSYGWHENGSPFSLCGRALRIYDNGDIEDVYYYPDGTESHSYFWGADGFYRELHYLDDGYFDSTSAWGGTIVYSKEIQPDGSYTEYSWPEQGNSTEIVYNANGYYRKIEVDQDGNYCGYVCNDPDAGTYQEESYYENGNLKYYKYQSPEDTREESHYENGNLKYYKYQSPEDTREESHYENGNLKYIQHQSPEYTQEERYDEDGFHTYFYSKDANFEIELTADETGKLIRYVENGTVYENEAIPYWAAESYNFRG